MATRNKIDYKYSHTHTQLINQNLTDENIDKNVRLKCKLYGDELFSFFFFPCSLVFVVVVVVNARHFARRGGACTHTHKVNLLG